MARELAIDVTLNSQEAQAALVQLYQQFRAAGDSALEASEKVEKFEKSYRNTSAKNEAKKALDGIQQSTQKVGDAAADAAKKQDVQTQATDQLRNAVLRYASVAVVGAAIKSTLDWAGNLSDLSKATGISTTALQKFEIIGRSSGVSMQEFANASLQLSNRLAGGDKSAIRAVEALGLSAQKLIAANPDEAMLSFAQALVTVDNPQKRVALTMDVLGRSGTKLLPMLEDMAKKWDDVNARLSDDAVKNLDDAGDKIDELTDAGKGLLANFLAPFAPILTAIAGALDPVAKLFSAFMKDVLSPLDLNKWREWKDNLWDAARAMQYITGVGPGIKAPLPGMPGAPTSPFMPSPLAVPGSPMSGAAGQSWSFLNSQNPTIARAIGGSGAKVLPFRSIAGTNAANLFAFANTPTGLGNFSLPFMSSLAPLESGASPLSFANGMQLPGGVPMYSPGTSGGFGSWLKGNKGKIGAAAGSMLAGYLGSKVGGKAGGALSGAAQGAQMGMMFGPWGAAVGGVVGGVAGWIGAGKAAKNKKNQELSDVYAQFSSDEFIKLQREAERLGVSLEKSLNAKTMKDFASATEDAAKKVKELTDMEDEIKRLTEASTVDFDKMNAVVQDFGLDIGKLGPAFQQAKLDKEAQKIIDAFAIMQKGGADMNGVLDGMSDEISSLVNDSIKFGTTIPENMRPWIDELMKSGRLVDENGQQITDMGKIKFGTAMESEMSKVVKKLDEMIAKLAELTASFRTTKGAAESLGNVDYTQPGTGSSDTGGSPDQGGNGFATGGVVGRDFRRPGNGDVFAALLRRGERVLPAGAAAGAGITINGLTVGSFSSRADAVDEIGNRIVSYIERRGGRLVA